MATLLVLGSKPDPVLPPPSAYDDLACANASGRSAHQHGLPAPTFTVMSSILTSDRQAANRLALQALRGLGTETLYLYPRPVYRRNFSKNIWHEIKFLKTKPFYVLAKLRSLEYRFEHSIVWPLEYYMQLVCALCDHDRNIAEQVHRKVPSTGMIAIALAVGERRYQRLIVSGFSFEITHAYAVNPLIAEQGSPRSKHADTDVAFLSYVSGKYRNIYTTEHVVHQRCGVPLLHA